MKPTRPPSPARGYKLKGRDTADGDAWREYWECQRSLAARGFRPTTVRLHFPDTPAGRAACAAKCERLTAESLQWGVADGAYPPRRYKGTVASLIDLYEMDPDSPFRAIKHTSRTGYADSLKIIRKTVGERRISALLGPDFKRWHRLWGQPAEAGGPERPWRAKGCIDRLRMVVAYGVTLGLADCARADAILGILRFAVLPARKERMTESQVEAIRKAAHAMGLHSVARTTTLQFALGMRRIDIIGEWGPATDAGAFPRGGKVWANGLTWAHIDAEWILEKVTTKTGETVIHDLKLHPDVREELGQRGIGPLVISEHTGAPWTPTAYQRMFRKVCDAAGLPRTVQSRDGRAGAITEAYAAGAAGTDVQKFAGHTSAKISSRYNREGIEQSSRVARLRQEKRSRNKS